MILDILICILLNKRYLLNNTTLHDQKSVVFNEKFLKPNFLEIPQVTTLI